MKRLLSLVLQCLGSLSKLLLPKPGPVVRVQYQDLPGHSVVNVSFK